MFLGSTSYSFIVDLPYALLLAIILPEMKQSFKAVILALGSGLLNTLILKMDILPAGWSIIVCIIVFATAGSFLFDKKKEEAYV